MADPISMAILAGVGMAGGAGAAIGKAATNSDKTNAHATNFVNNAGAGYDASRYYYGGTPTGAQDMANYGMAGSAGATQTGQRLTNLGLGAQGRVSAAENEELANLAMGGRQWQEDAATLAMEQALGLAPSEAAYALQQGVDRTGSAIASQTASARGAGALSNATAGGVGATAALDADAYNEGARLAAQETAAGRAQLGQISGQLRTGDINRLGQANEMAQFNARANDAYTLGMGQIGLGYGQLGKGYYDSAQNPYDKQLQANLEQQRMAAIGHRGAEDQNIAINKYNTEAVAKRWDALGNTFGNIGKMGGMGGMGGGGPGIFGGKAG